MFGSIIKQSAAPRTAAQHEATEAFLRLSAEYNKVEKNVEPGSSIDEINKRTCESAGRLEYFIETFQVVSVARGHSR